MFFRLAFIAMIVPNLTEASINVCSVGDKALFIGNQEFANHISDFAVRSFGISSGTVEKLTRTYPTLTPACAECFGEAVACGTKNCFLKCAISANSPGCVACSTGHCRPRLLACVGAKNESELPPAPADRAAPSAPPAKKRERKLGQADVDDEDLFDFVQIVFGSGVESDFSLPVDEDEEELTLSLYNHPGDLDDWEEDESYAGDDEKDTVAV